jgi:hypothetical protein
MLEQLDLFSSKSDRYKNFIKYHQENPQIWQVFEKFCLDAIKRGHNKLSAEFIVNIIRWETRVSATDDDFKINNTYKPFYSRLFLQTHPNLKTFFELRDSWADELKIEDLK